MIVQKNHGYPRDYLGRTSRFFNNKLNLKIKPMVLVAFCVFLYMPNFKMPSAVLQIFSTGIPILYLLFNLKTIGKFNSKQWVILVLALLLMAFSYFIPILYGTMDFSYFSTLSFFLKRAIVYLALMCLIIKAHGKERALQYFMYYFVITNIVYVIGTLILVLTPNLRSFWFSLIYQDSITMENLKAIDASEYTFRIGWQGFSGFQQTLYCTLSAIFALYLKYGTRPAAINMRQFFIAFVACILGNMFYGRSGLIVTILVSLIAIIYWNRKNIKRLIIFGASTAFLIVIGFSVLKNIPELSEWYEWMSSPITNLVATGDMQDKSFDKLQTMWQTEIPMETIIYGDGHYSEDGHYYMSTDVGFMRNILFWGMLGFILSYGLTFYAILGLGKISKLLMLQVLVVFIIFEYKGASYYVFLPIVFMMLTAQRIEYIAVKSGERPSHSSK